MNIRSQAKNIVVLDDYEQSMNKLADWSRIKALANVEFHQRKLTGEPLLAALREADAVVLMRDRTPFKSELIAELPRLKYVVFTGLRNTALDADALRRREIPVSFTDGGPGKENTAELACGLILAATKRLLPYTANLKQGTWRDGGPLADTLSGERLGLIGLGGVGGKVAAFGRAIGMNVVTWSPHMTSERAAAAGVQAVELEELLRTSKVVSLHLVPSPATVGLMNAERLALMRADSLLVNTARAALIDAPALLKALDAGAPRMAALDVFDREPVFAADPLLNHRAVLATPHLGFVSDQIFTCFAKGVVEGLEAWLEGRPTVRPYVG